MADKVGFGVSEGIAETLSQPATTGLSLLQGIPEEKDLNQEILVKLQSTFVTSLSESKAKESLEGLKAFEVRKVRDSTYVGLPTNMENLAISYYLFKLFLKANQVLKIKGVAVSERYETHLPKNKDVNPFYRVSV